MALTIATLPYQENKGFLHTILREKYSWFDYKSVLTGYKGKATISNYSFNSPILTVADCLIDSIDTTLDAKEVELVEYNFSFPVSRCELQRTWLNAFAEKYQDASEVYIENLMPYIAEQVGTEVKNLMISSMTAEAIADANVEKIPEVPAITPQDYFDGMVSFVASLSDAFLKRTARSSYYDDSFQLYVSPEAYRRASLHVTSTFGTGSMSIGGFYIRPEEALNGVEMICTSESNFLSVWDDNEDVNRFTVVAKEELSTDYIVGAMSFVGSYVNSKDIVITI